MWVIKTAVTPLPVSEPRKPSWLLPWKGQRVHSPASPGVEEHQCPWGSGKFGSPGASPRSSLPLLPLPPLPFLWQEANVVSQHHILLMAKGSFASTDRKPWTNLNKKVFAVAKELWSRIFLKWKCTHKALVHNTLCSVKTLMSFCWPEVGWYAGFLVAKSLQLFG